MEGKKGISGSTIKIIALIAMFIDHFAAVILDNKLKTLGINSISSSEEALRFLSENGKLYYTDMAMRYIGRLGFPIFVFLLVEGFVHTRNVWKYLRNLCIFALVSEIPFNLAIASKWFSYDYQNVFFTLAIGLLVLIGISEADKKESWNKTLQVLSYPAFFIAGPMTLYMLFTFAKNWGFMAGAPTAILSSKYIFVTLIMGLLSLVCLLVIFRFKTADEKASVAYGLYALYLGIIIADILKTDYSGSGVLVIAAMYAFKNRGKVKEAAIGCTLLTLMQSVEITSFLILIPISKYNGKRGINLKYFFYAFYPVHLTLFYIICVILKYV